VPDDDGRQGWTVLVDDVPSSHVDLADATRLDFEYMRWAADLVDVLAEPGAGLRVVHLGGGGLSLPRYVAATRPASRQVVLERDAEVVHAVRTAFGFASTSLLRVLVGDGRAGLAAVADDSTDLVIRDAFDGGSVPQHLATSEFLEEVRRVLGERGLYVANLADRPPLALARAEVATAGSCFPHVALAAEPGQFKGRRYGNFVLAASTSPLPEIAWGRRLAGGVVRARLLGTGRARDFAAGAPVNRDAG
jgi:spermidine synthase